MRGDNDVYVRVRHLSSFTHAVAIQLAGVFARKESCRVAKIIIGASVDSLPNRLQAGNLRRVVAGHLVAQPFHGVFTAKNRFTANRAAFADNRGVEATNATNAICRYDIDIITRAWG